MITRIQVMCMTAKTRLDYDGVKITPTDRSIHPMGRGGKDKGWKYSGGRICEPSRLRPGKPYSGGRALRKNTARLAARTSGYNAKDESQTAPGRMSGY